MFEMTRRTFLKTTGALFAAPAIVKAENIMKIWTPPEQQIILPDEQIVTKPNFTLDGTMPGDQIYVQDTVTGQVLINEHADGRRFSRAVPESDHQLRIGIARRGCVDYNNRCTVFPGGSVKIRAIGFLTNG